MGYTFTIGNATPWHDKEDGVLSAGWRVKGVTLDDAPEFPNDDMTGKSNSRSPSYSGWSDFCKAVGIYSLFYDDHGHLHYGHPGCRLITPEDLCVVSAARAKWQAKATLPPGFAKYPEFIGGEWVHPDIDKYDPQLARVLWLEFWMSWALANCETPAIQNT